MDSNSLLLVSRSTIHCDLLRLLVQRELGRSLRCCAPTQVPATLPAGSCLLIDMGSLSREEFADVVSRRPTTTVLINMTPGESPDALVAIPGVRGIFTLDDGTDALLRGLQAILRGEYWLPRAVLWRHLESTRANTLPLAEIPRLSRKEVQILGLLQLGHSNERIADTLAISPHTVKTHFYNLYRKLQVANRVQAAAWARDHLASVAVAE